MGISLRVDALALSAPSEERRAAIRDSAKRVTDRSGMGEEYKVLGMTSIDKRDGLVGAEVWPFEVKEEKMFEDCVHVEGKK
jgi:NADH dehydrogenase [ubiquinone] 1 alpha subcomplex assembly factor 7